MFWPLFHLLWKLWELFMYICTFTLELFLTEVFILSNMFKRNDLWIVTTYMHTGSSQMTAACNWRKLSQWSRRDRTLGVRSALSCLSGKGPVLVSIVICCFFFNKIFIAKLKPLIYMYMEHFPVCFDAHIWTFCKYIVSTFTHFIYFITFCSFWKWRHVCLLFWHWKGQQAVCE